MDFPKDAVMLLSVVNMKLRDEDLTLDELCDRYELEKEELVNKLSSIGYEYDKLERKFR